MSVDPSSIAIDYSRDGLLNDFTLQTLQERYLINGETSPQQAFARAAAAFADDVEHAQRLYDYVSKLWFMFATPLLSNGGSERGLPISCFLNGASDSREGIFGHWNETGWLSSVGGGVGGYWGDLRSSGEKTSRGSSSTGVIPFIAVVDRLILSVSQGGTRRGSYAAYLDISHPEIEEFITMRKPTGGDQNRKATNLHNAVNISDEFMHAVTDDSNFHLRSPHDGSIRKTLKARDLWRLLLETRMQTGEPYMVFIDTINRTLPEPQKALGLKVRHSNLCVAPYTEILTDKGFKPIVALADQTVNAWNGREFSQVVITETSDSAELVRVWFSDGDYLDCTPEHNFFVDQNGEYVKIPAAALHEGMEIERYQPPFIPTMTVLSDLDLAFTAGWAMFAGYEENGKLTLVIDADTYHETITRLVRHSVDMRSDGEFITIHYEASSIPTGFVPFNWCHTEKVAWLQGALEAAGDWLEDSSYFCLGSTDADVIREMRLLALEVGVNAEVRLTDTLNALMLSDLNHHTLYTDKASRWSARVSVVEVSPLPGRQPTYCATEPKRGRLCFNGYLTGNCTEITLPSGRDFSGKERTAVCCLSSVNADKYDEWKEVESFIPDLMRMLDNALSVFITNAPTELANAVYSATRERSVGLGLLGFQAYLQSKLISIESNEARKINLEIFSRIKTAADKASLDLGRERGEAPDMAGTGERFAHKLAIAPNASSSIICGGTSPSIEPHRANAYLHKTLSGSFPVRNPYLVKVLQELDLDTDITWQSIIAHEGSVQQLDIPQNIKDVFKTAPEIDQMVLVRLAADRAPLICQAQSLNLFFEHDTEAGKITEAHFRAWEWGVKSLYYLRSTTPKRAENTNTKVARIEMMVGGHILSVPADLATGGPGGASGASAIETDESCLACEG